MKRSAAVEFGTTVALKYTKKSEIGGLWWPIVQHCCKQRVKVKQCEGVKGYNSMIAYYPFSKNKKKDAGRKETKDLLYFENNESCCEEKKQSL